LADDGTILHAVLQDPALALAAPGAWVGQPWSQTVGSDSRDKIATLLREALAGDAPRWRQVNHPMAGEDDLPVLYAAVSLPDDGHGRRVVAFGRDLRSTVVLQRRLVEAQQAMERDYWRFREAETRYRNLFQTSPEAVLVVDGQNLKVLEANPAAEVLAGRAGLRLVGAALASLFDSSGAEPLQALVAAARSVGKREPVRLALAQGKGAVDVVASLFRQDQVPFLLVRILPLQGVGSDGAALAGMAPRGEGSVSPNLLEAYARLSPDGLVFTDVQGRITTANRAFANLAQLSAEEQARGEMLDRWLGRTGVELGVLDPTCASAARWACSPPRCAVNSAPCWKWRSRPRSGHARGARTRALAAQCWACRARACTSSCGALASATGGGDNHHGDTSSKV
jgi:transcriptional regulator PpsR